MKKLSTAFVAILLFTAFSCESNEPPIHKAYNEGINITPMPLELTQNEGTFVLSKSTSFVSTDESVNKVVAFFASKIKKSTGYDLKIEKVKPESNYINLTIAPQAEVGDEGYLLEVTDKGIDIQAKTAQGLFYGMQTVMQLLPAEIESPALIKNIAWNIPAVKVKDEPRFQYRGMHLDVCRHFVDVDFIKKQLDVLAIFKMNKFHWHLTDDQGWRIEIKKYPKLTEIGAQRIEGEGNTYGPYFYTQDQIKEVVAYAKERFIEVIPEIEMPGHGVAAIAAYPELSCKGVKIPVRNIWGVANDVYCAGNDSLYTFLEDVMTEVIPLFESEYIHVGGDECPKGRWKECPKCQARIKELGLKGDKEHSAEEKLQSYVVQRMAKFLETKNKKMIGWDEILEGGGLPLSATVMSWRGESGGIVAGNAGHNVIMTPGAWCYLDKYQGDSKILPVTIGGYLPLDKVYNYDPMPIELAKDKQHHVWGTQANIWCEYKYTPEGVEYDIYPRIIALAEVAWSAIEKKDEKDFLRRLENQRVRLDMHAINYYIPIPEQAGAPSCDFVAFTDSVSLEFKTTEPVKIVYTIDGSTPSVESTVYEGALTFKESTPLKIRSVVLSGKMSAVREITVEKQTYAPAVEKDKDAKSGMKAEYYKGIARKFGELDGKTPDEVAYVAAPQDSKYRIPDYREVYDEDYWSTALTGYIDIPENGVYYFSTDFEMWLDGKLFISSEREEGKARKISRSDKSAALAKGYHSVKLVRLGAIFGGFPTQWESIYLYMRKDGEPSFKVLDATSFK